MKRIKLKDFKENMGIFIDLEKDKTIGFSYKNELKEDYDNLLVNHKEILNKKDKYFIFCKGGVRSKKAVAILELYGYDVTLVYK